MNLMEDRSRIKVVEGGDERTRPKGEDLSARKAPGNGSIKLTVNCNLQNAQQRLRVLSFRKRWILFEPKDALKSPCLPEMIFALRPLFRPHSNQL